MRSVGLMFAFFAASLCREEECELCHSVTTLAEPAVLDAFFMQISLEKKKLQRGRDFGNSYLFYFQRYSSLGYIAIVALPAFRMHNVFQVHWDMVLLAFVPGTFCGKV